jgi:hypothetical protein
VVVTGTPEQYGRCVSANSLCCIVPNATTESDLWDDAPGGGIVYDCVVDLIFYFRHEDPQLRDEGVELLFSTAADLLQGQAIVPGLTIPARTRSKTWQWLEPIPPERKIKATLWVQYQIDGWDQLGTSP